MAQQFTGEVEILNEGGRPGNLGLGPATRPGQGSAPSNRPGQVRITLDGNSGTGTLGGNGEPGTLAVTNGETQTIRLEGRSGVGHFDAGRFKTKIVSSEIECKEIHCSKVEMAPNGRKRTILLDGASGTEFIIKLVCSDTQGHQTILIDGSSGKITIGNAGTDGELVIRNDNGQDCIRLDGKTGHAKLGGNRRHGALLLYDESVTKPDDPIKARIRLDAVGGNAWLGGNGADGDLVLFDRSVTETDDAAKARIRLEGAGGNAWLGGNGVDGDLVLFPKEVTETSDHSKATIHLDGEKGDIVLRNADCAEEFDVAHADEVEPGSVMIISSDNELRISTQAYDKRVAGIVSGAGDYKPGILLDRNNSSRIRRPIALMGKVYCKVDASRCPIEVGDLLTSADVPGHAMKATDLGRAVGTIIGKALKPLDAGTGLVPILVALQ